ncbi:hypothetical protein MA16_Dca004299 [Dendrobium catenatum]|uniref:Uncharacterized protein n=1 Tax=Dendrobium catenatum TaxID=906689 RepID=A0A2I0W717_9ASPA|nr:hypothetical protein MA16_Dca004299 [Dendrobium catenatum]
MCKLPWTANQNLQTACTKVWTARLDLRNLGSSSKGDRILGQCIKSVQKNSGQQFGKKNCCVPAFWMQKLKEYNRKIWE